VALCKSAIAGKLGAEINLSKIPGKAKEEDAILFSESQGRMLVSVRREAQKKFEKIYQGVTLILVGEVTQDASVSITLPKEKIQIPLSVLSDAYKSFFKNW
jgi:phosphoribosylformylglycinamidine synthase